jgi:hypothetical protein
VAANFELDISPVHRLTLASTFTRASGWTYAGNLTNLFQLGEEIDYELRPNLIAMLGYANGGNLLKANGIDSNFALFNSESSSVYGALDYRF